MLSHTTVVLGGGGVWGVAWMTGLLTGLAEGGLDLSGARSFIGTSAGSVLSTQLTCGHSLQALFDRQVRPELQPRERAPAPEEHDGQKRSSSDWGVLGELLRDTEMHPAERSRRLGALALKSPTIPFEERRRDIADRLGLSDDVWPSTDLKIAAVEVQTGDLVAFDSGSQVSLIDAVSASCAVPGVWPPTPIDGRLYIDGGVWKTSENAHLAKGAANVIVVSPVGRMTAPGALAEDIEMLRQSGSRVTLIAADEKSMRAGVPNLLDPATRKPGAEAGREQGRHTCASLRNDLFR
jgi:NTE family protein